MTPSERLADVKSVTLLISVGCWVSCRSWSVWTRFWRRRRWSSRRWCWSWRPSRSTSGCRFDPLPCWQRQRCVCVCVLVSVFELSLCCDLTAETWMEPPSRSVVWRARRRSWAVWPWCCRNPSRYEKKPTENQTKIQVKITMWGILFLNNVRVLTFGICQSEICCSILRALTFSFSLKWFGGDELFIASLFLLNCSSEQFFRRI